MGCVESMTGDGPMLLGSALDLCMQQGCGEERK